MAPGAVDKSAVKRAKAHVDKYGLPKKENFKEYDLKTNKIVEVKKKKKVNYGSDSSQSVERWAMNS